MISLINEITGSTAASSNATISLGALSLQQDDVLIIAINFSGSTSNIPKSASGNASGACVEVADLYSNDTYDTNLGVYIAVQGASPDSTITVAAGSFLIPWLYSVRQYRGVDISNVQDVAATTSTGTNTDLANPPSITPVTSGALIVAVYGGAQRNNTAWTAPANLDNFVQAVDTSRTRLGVGHAAWSSGAFDPDPVTGGSGDTRDSWAAVSMVLRPAPVVSIRRTKTRFSWFFA